MKKRVGLGVLAGMGTGVFWGFPFLIPQVLSQVPSFQIAFGRFLFFGLMSLFWIKKVVQIIRGLAPRDRLQLFFLSACGFWFYTIVLFWSVQKTDGIISSLIVGLLPICIPLFTPGRRNSGFGFYLGLSILLIGLVNLFVAPLVNGASLKSPSLAGVLGLLACLGMWTWFAIANSRFLQARPEINRKDFASVIGFISLLCMLPLFFLKVDLDSFVHQEHFGLYLFCAAVLGVGSSWIANWLWNICSYHCPSEVSGPLIVSETIFGLLYSFVYEARLPHVYEGVSIVLFLLGVLITVRSQLRVG